MMNEQIDNVTKDDAKALLDSINQQKIETSNNAQMPTWFNLFLSSICTVFVSFEYLDYRFGMPNFGEGILFLLLIAGIVGWDRILKKRGINAKILPFTKIAAFGFLLGVFSAMYFSDLLMLLDNNYSQFFSYFMMLFLTAFIYYLGKKYPLSESIPEVNQSADR